MVGQCRKSFQYIILSRSKIFQFNEDFIKSYNQEGQEGYFLEVDVQYPEKLHDLHNDLPFLPKKNEDRKSHKACS